MGSIIALSPVTESGLELSQPFLIACTLQRLKDPVEALIHTVIRDLLESSEPLLSHNFLLGRTQVNQHLVPTTVM